MANTHKPSANMTVKIVANEKGNPPGKLADAELHFGERRLSSQTFRAANPRPCGDSETGRRVGCGRLKQSR